MAQSYPIEEDICNLALGRLGQFTITDLFEENNETARLCRLHLPMVRRELMRMHAWCFAVTRLKLPESELGDPFGTEELHRFVLPCNHLQTLEIYGDAELLHRIDKFTREGLNIYCQFDEAYMIYIKDIVSPLEWDVDFIACVVVLLASRLAGPLGSSEGPALLQELQQVTLQTAMLNNSYEDGSGENNPTDDRIRRSGWHQAYRKGGLF
jgi:hypothetical protein